ncbi:MAG: histidinol phosphate phosphatase domain-containing protein [Smithellaceae bacterium]|nr:histidinol phosphate phosphatase domain-containing protein [Smithellaceae bacterium]MDD3258941.1 histidinol phosphate phosphatase domain-containing protein [Smithellaceae bacterium]MDD3848534.1 histidinol phosphate phosphatase domain-containing protein [Smithellaceae bacterium]HOG12583.1 histidinol phosphate phosphatase domain-containing protein [Smithellaceae bacterium]HPL09151.1 histidinol phosphate phosphatase domain-containing protein [Smithellaceae bacterium]
MIDLHTHTLFSDGALIPAETARRAFVAGYKAIALTDHVDDSNIDFVIPRMVRVCGKLSEKGDIFVIPGVELTHVDPSDIASLAAEARKLGAKIVVVHGETLTEPVPPGTNLAAIRAGVDILAHPGLITREETKLAAKKGVYLEITTRRGHSYTNGHVAAMAGKCGADLVLNNDAHAPGDFAGRPMAVNIARGAGLSEKEIVIMFKNSQKIVQRARA